jgi:hypothetical protein
MLRSDLPSDDPLLALADCLIPELPMLGRLCQDAQDPQRRDLVRHYCARRELPLLSLFLFVWLEQGCGLRFADARLPHWCYGATWPPGQPLAGYTDAAPAPLPSQWLIAVFNAWKVITAGESPADREAHSVSEQRCGYVLRAGSPPPCTTRPGRHRIHAAADDAGGAAGRWCRLPLPRDHCVASRGTTDTRAEVERVITLFIGRRRVPERQVCA